MLKSSMMRMGVQACAGGSSLQNITLRASVATATSAATANKQKVVVVGAGWAGYRVAQDLDKTKFDVEVVSPRNHFLFTPLLPSTAVGTLEFRCIQEPVRTIPDIHYYQAEVKEIDFGKNELVCNDAFEQHYSFKLPYDVLIVAPGSETNTFNIPGVLNNPNVFFLKQLEHSRAIRNKLIDCFEKASSPSLANNLAMKKELLTFVVVGGGPINIEFAAELYDFLKSDVARWYPDLFPLASVKIIEASGHLLNTFHSTIVNYVERLFASRNIDLMMTTTVTKIDDHTVFLNNNQSFKFGLMVWSTGIKQVPFVQALSPAKVAKFPNGRLKIDEHLHVLQPMTSTTAAPTTTATSTSSVSGTESPYTLLGAGKVFALGDCAGNALKPLPSLAQVRLLLQLYSVCNHVSSMSNPCPTVPTCCLCIR